MTDFYVGIQIVRTADDWIQQLGELQRLTGTDLVSGFSYGRMPPDKAELNMRLFAERVMPMMQHDAAFAGPAVVPERSGKRHDEVFAPAQALANPTSLLRPRARAAFARTAALLSQQAVWRRKLTAIAKQRTQEQGKLETK